MRKRPLIAAALAWAICSAAAVAQQSPATPTPAIDPNAAQNPVAGPDAVPARPVLAPDQTNAAPVPAPDTGSITPAPVLGPDSTQTAPVVGPDQTQPAPVLAPVPSDSQSQ